MLQDKAERITQAVVICSGKRNVEVGATPAVLERTETEGTKVETRETSFGVRFYLHDSSLVRRCPCCSQSIEFVTISSRSGGRDRAKSVGFQWIGASPSCGHVCLTAVGQPHC